ncbi:hypothetical protein M0245_004897 [Salmonella enterica]|nr:hypothetical protein [Salmonella enterica]
MVNHPDSVTYDAFDCNSGKPHEPNTHWDHSSNSWEWNDLKLNPGSVPDSLPEEVKEALANNICIICGKKNCPYIKNNKDYQKLTDALKNGNTGEARKIYMTKFGQRRGQSKAVVMEGLQKARNARKNGACTVPYTGPIQHKRAIAMPGVWSEPVELAGSATANNEYPDVYTVNFNPSSNMESSFDVEIKYPEANGMKVINTIGPGSYTIKATGAGNSYIRVKSHSVPVTVTFEFPKK